MLPVFLESAISIGFLAPGGDRGRAGRGRRLVRLLLPWRLFRSSRVPSAGTSSPPSVSRGT